MSHEFLFHAFFYFAGVVTVLAFVGTGRKLVAQPTVSIPTPAVIEETPDAPAFDEVADPWFVDSNLSALPEMVAIAEVADRAFREFLLLPASSKRYTLDALKGMKIRQLREIAKTLKVKGYSRLKLIPLAEAIYAVC